VPSFNKVPRAGLPACSLHHDAEGEVMDGKKEAASGRRRIPDSMCLLRAPMSI